MDNYLHLPFIRSSPIDLVITRYPEVFSIVPRILCAYCLAVLCHMNTPSNKSSHLSSIRSSLVVDVFHKSLQNTIRSSENPQEPFALEILAYLHYGETHKSRSLIDIPCHYHFESIDSICLRIPAIIIGPYKLPFRLSFHSFNWNWFSTNPIVFDCTLRLFNLSTPNQNIASDPLIWKS